MDIEQLLQRIKDLEKEVELQHFKQQLLFYNTDVDRILFEYDITKEQYSEIMDLMEGYRKSIGQKKDVSSGAFESQMYKITPQHNGDYHFVEYLTKAFWEAGRWEEVFVKLYGNSPKYKHLKKDF